MSTNEHQALQCIKFDMGVALFGLFKKRKKKKYRVAYLVMVGWGVMEEEFYCKAYSKKEAHRLYVDQVGPANQYTDKKVRETFSLMQDDIYEIPDKAL